MSDEKIRSGIRNFIKFWLKKLNCEGDVEKKLFYKQKFIQNLKQLPIAIKTDAPNKQHYEVPTSFFLTVLGKRMKYSSALFPKGIVDLDEAEDAMLSLVCRRARVEDGQTIMDLGCGWGSLTFWLLEKYPSCRVTCVSNSSTQGEHIRNKAERIGAGHRVVVYTADANSFETNSRFDRIISIEMFEHMKNYDRLFQKVASWLTPHGLLFTQILCHREFTYHFKSNGDAGTEWMTRHFFTGGTMPSSDLFLYFQNHVAIEQHWNVSGVHYQKTLDAWLKKMDEKIDEVRAIFQRAYGRGSVVEENIQNWRKFFMYCSEVFGCNNGNDWIVSHHLFRKQSKSNL